MTHDPHRFANDLGAKLAARSRHVVVFAGAGIASACGLPDVATLERRLLTVLEQPRRGQLERQLDGGNVEHALSRLRRIATLLEGSEETVDGLTAADAQALDIELCRGIVAQLDHTAADLTPMLRMASWAGRADYLLPVELFTVNYDLLIETALEQLGVAYFDGFVGALRARFRTDLVEAGPDRPEEWLPGFVVRLWKLHGSVSWRWSHDAEAGVLRLGGPVDPAEVAAIYPSDSKYDESRRVPFLVLQDRLRRALYAPETLVLVTGYSWHDEHLNELLFDAAMRRPRSEFVVFVHSQVPEPLATQAQSLPNLQVLARGEAIIGASRGRWDAPAEELADVWGESGFLLSDFAHLAAYLARSSPPHPDIERRLQELGAAVAGG